MLALLTVFGIVFRAAVHSVLWKRIDDGLDRKVAALQRMYTGLLVDPAKAPQRLALAEQTVSRLDHEIRSLPGTTSRGSGPSRAWPIRVLNRQGHALLRAYARMQGVDEPWDAAMFQRSLAGETVRANLGGQRLVSVPLQIGGKVLGVIQGGEPLAEAENVLGNLDSTLKGAAPFAVVFSALLGWILAVVALRPVRSLSQEVISIEPEGRNLLPERSDELAPIAQSFNEVLARLRNSFRSIEVRATRQRDFTDEVSHELRSPLTVVTANASFLLAQEKLSPADRDALEAILAASKSMTRLVDDLLLVARVDEGAELHPEPIDVGAMLRLIDRNELKVQFEIEEDLVVVADREHFIRVFRNLLDNARLHGQASSVRIFARREGNTAEIVVEDDGVGMSPEALERIGERFFRGDTAAKGFGLGVSICRGLLEAHGGSISFENAETGGIRATVRLPSGDREDAFKKTLI